MFEFDLVSSDIHFLHTNIAAYCPGRLDLAQHLPGTMELKAALVETNAKNDRAGQRILIEANIDLLRKAAWEISRAIVVRWNEVVKPEDKVLLTGDICMGNLIHSIPLVSQLNGRKFLITGNHDKKALKSEDFCKNFEWIKTDLEETVEISGREIVIKMRHYPPGYEELTLKEDGEHRKFRPNTYAIFGHRHGNVAHDPRLPCLDVGLDAQNLLPISREAILKHIEIFLSHLDANDAPVPTGPPAEEEYE